MEKSVRIFPQTNRVFRIHQEGCTLVLEVLLFIFGLATSQSILFEKNKEYKEKPLGSG